jgi:hypothetical protein
LSKERRRVSIQKGVPDAPPRVWRSTGVPASGFDNYGSNEEQSLLSIYSTSVPRAPLADFVESFWFYESHTPLLHARERRLPGGSVELVINLREDVVRVYDRQDINKLHSFRTGVISGPYSTFFLIDTNCLSSMIGVAFKPGGTAPFLCH